MIARILRSPAAVEDTTDTDKPTFGIGSAKSVFASVMDFVNKNEPAPPKKEEPSGQTTPADRPAGDKPQPDPGMADDGKGGGDGAPGGVGAAPDGAPDKTAAIKPGAVVKPDDNREDWEKAPAPKGAKEWDKWKDGRRKAETTLREQITARETQLQELQTKLADLETKASVSGQIPDSVKAEIDHRDKQIKELTEKITVLDVTQHPKFQAYFQGKTEAAISKAKRLVGADRADVIEKLVKLPEGEYKTAQLEEFMSEIDSDLTKSRLAVVLEEMDNIGTEREQAIKDAETLKEKTNGESAAKAVQRQAAAETVFKDTLKNFQDPKTGFALFQTKDGDPAHNEAVTKRIEAARGLLFNDKVKPESLAKAAFYAVALPHILQVLHAESEGWKKEKEGYEAKLKELVVAQPKPGAGGDGDNAIPRVKAGMKPQEVTKAVWADVQRRINE